MEVGVLTGTNASGQSVRDYEITTRLRDGDRKVRANGHMVGDVFERGVCLERGGPHPPVEAPGRGVRGFLGGVPAWELRSEATEQEQDPCTRLDGRCKPRPP